MNFGLLCRNGNTAEFKPGVYTGMAREVYDNIPALSASVLKKWLSLREIPSEFRWWATIDRWKDELPSWLLVGSGLDCRALEGALFSSKYAVIPRDAPRRPNKLQLNARNPSNETVAAISFWKKFEAESNGKRILDAAQYEAICKMHEALMTSPVIKGVFDNCQKIVIVSELWGLPAKCEIDLWNPKIPHILDLKTAKDVEPREFSRAVQFFGYLEQAVFYLLMADAAGFSHKNIFSFIAVKNSEPWTVAVRNFAPLNRDDHKLIFAATVDRLKRGAFELTERLQQNDFSDSTEWGLLEFPSWYLKEKSTSLALGYEYA